MKRHFKHLSTWAVLRRLGHLFAILAILISRPAAVAAEPHRASGLQPAYDCLAIAADAERLACLQSAVSALRKAEADGEITVVDRTRAKEIRRETFGFSLPKLWLPGGSAKDDMSKVVLQIEHVAPTPSRRWVFVTREGPVWEQTDDDPVRNPHKGSSLEIERGALGSYFCSIDGQVPVRCVRNR